jgi:hypothetical protein
MLGFLLLPNPRNKWMKKKLRLRDLLTAEIIIPFVNWKHKFIGETTAYMT